MTVLICLEITSLFLSTSAFSVVELNSKHLYQSEAETTKRWLFSLEMVHRFIIICFKKQQKY
jgi:hypothetical protein